MFTDFTLLVVASGLTRLGLNALVFRRFNLRLSVPQALAGALVVFAGLPTIVKPLPWPIPLSVTLGLLLPDLLLRRA